MDQPRHTSTHHLHLPQRCLPVAVRAVLLLGPDLQDQWIERFSGFGRTDPDYQTDDSEAEQ